MPTRAFRRQISAVSRRRQHGFLALLLHRVLRLRRNVKASLISPERALEIARRIQYHQVTLHQRQPPSGLSAITPQPKQLFEPFALPEPSARRL